MNVPCVTLVFHTGTPVAIGHVYCVYFHCADPVLWQNWVSCVMLPLQPQPRDAELGEFEV